jgi:hypothetical protein
MYPTDGPAGPAGPLASVFHQVDDTPGVILG